MRALDVVTEWSKKWARLSQNDNVLFRLSKDVVLNRNINQLNKYCMRWCYHCTNRNKCIISSTQRPNRRPFPPKHAVDCCESKMNEGGCHLFRVGQEPARSHSKRSIEAYPSRCCMCTYHNAAAEMISQLQHCLDKDHHSYWLISPNAQIFRRFPRPIMLEDRHHSSPVTEQFCKSIANAR